MTRDNSTLTRHTSAAAFGLRKTGDTLRNLLDATGVLDLFSLKKSS